ncbi:hypothetical protein [Tautonia plasticadhaerens]|uniref:Uncharacterized protein n=1 Tax=Tautonia plasticadhaerens TaxID=2527974 RepID=A0A518GZE7_9BACT|nr:hypothetical protein [Tautonia plasticadhaerens]QDV33964.1 hypothetical protein ElP_18450 [Tautonia plasticadhaerens]
MSASIFKLVDDLPENNLTVRMLRALDFVAPGQWTNLVGFERTIKELTGEKDEAMVQKVGERAIHLYNDKGQGYRNAVWLYGTAEAMSTMIGAASLADKVGESWSMLRFIRWLTPKADRAQALDFGIKTVIEMLAFCKINGMPGDHVGDFVKALGHYKDEALMRMAALICVDGLLPLGPDFLDKAIDAVKKGSKTLEEHEAFRQIEGLIPGSHAKKVGVMRETVEGVSGWMGKFAKKHHLTQQSVADRLEGFVEGAEGKLDYLAAFIDVSTNYYEHTGIQSVARSLILRAVNEV